MIAELLGLPGSGKTHLAPILAAENRLPLIRVGRLGQRRLYAWLFALLNPRLARSLRRRCKEESGNDTALRRIKEHRLTSALAKVQKARMLRRGLIDEGILQVLLASYEREAMPEDFEDILKLLPPDRFRVYIIEADETVRLARMQARGKFPRAELGAAYWQSWNAAQTANLPLLARLLRRRFECRDIANSESVTA